MNVSLAPGTLATWSFGCDKASYTNYYKLKNMKTRYHKGFSSNVDVCSNDVISFINGVFCRDINYTILTYIALSISCFLNILILFSSL